MVPAFSFSRFKVTPPGTCKSESTIVEHDFLDTLAEEYPSDPLKVQDVALLATAFSKLGAEVGAGAGFAKAVATPRRAGIARCK